MSRLKEIESRYKFNSKGSVTKYPREFWIIGDEVYTSEQENGPLRFHAEQIHVREVVSIDWEKIWKEYEGNFPWTEKLEKEHLQILIEEQLRGEE